MDDKAIVFYQGRAYNVRVSIEASTPVEDAVKIFDEMSETRLTIIPHGEVFCAGFAKFEDRKFFLMYFPPKRRRLLWKNKLTQEKKEFIVFWPHFYIGIFFRGGAIENGYGMVSKKRLEKPSDKLGRLPMPNLSKKFGHICEGREGKWDIRARVEDTAVKYAEYFMNSEFISDINDHFPSVPKQFWPPNWDLSRPIGESNIEDVNQSVIGIWQALSEKNPKAIEETVEWPETFTIGDLVLNEWRGKVSIGGNPISNVDLAEVVMNQIPVAVGMAAHFVPDPH